MASRHGHRPDLQADRRRSQGPGAAGMTLRIALGPVMALAVSAAACQPMLVSDKDFGERVRAYLLAHPEVLEEANQRLQADAEARVAAAQRRAEANLPQL